MRPSVIQSVHGHTETSVAVTAAQVAEVMPHASEDGGAAGEDACSSDELIVFKDEDGGEDVVKRSSDKVTEEKSDLIDLSESEVSVVHSIPYVISITHSKHNKPT